MRKPQVWYRFAVLAPIVFGVSLRREDHPVSIAQYIRANIAAFRDNSDIYSSPPRGTLHPIPCAYAL